MNLLDLLGDAAAIAANPVVGLAKVALDVAPDIASLFGDDAEKAVGKLADTVRAVTGTDDPVQAREALADPNLVFQLRSQAQTFAHEERMQELANGLAREEWRAFFRLCGFGLEAAWAFVCQGGMSPDGIIEAVDVAANGVVSLAA